MTELVLRELEGLDEFAQALAFQESIWGAGFSEAVPRSIMKVTQRLGGVVAGAFQDDRMVGFVFGITGIENGRAVHWSDILAVEPGHRDLGIGRRLKAFQRQLCLERQITVMHWSYDPLESRNGYLNLVKLGAVVREYVPDMYGVSDSPLHRGLGTDRFVVTWELDSERVSRRMEGRAGPPQPEAAAHLPLAFTVDTSRGGGMVRPAESVGEDWLERLASAGGGRIAIPPDIQRLRDAEPSLAAEWRGHTRAALQAAVTGGFQVEDLIRGAGVSEYLVRPLPPGPVSGHEPGR